MTKIIDATIVNMIKISNLSKKEKKALFAYKMLKDKYVVGMIADKKKIMLL